MSLKHENGPEAEPVQVPERILKYLASLIVSQIYFSLELLPIVIQKYLRLLKVGRGWAE